MAHKPEEAVLFFGYKPPLERTSPEHKAKRDEYLYAFLFQMPAKAYLHAINFNYSIAALMDVLVSGKTSFKVEVPYKLIETGPKGEKPLIVYLHGKGQNIPIFEKLMRPMLDFNAYHLFIQGPYPDAQATGDQEKWRHMWYLYNGRQGSFIKSMEYTAEFIQEIVDHVIQFIKVSRLCVIGYSMGGYQGAYFGTSRWKHTNEIIVMAARIKTELLTGKWDKLTHQHILAIHGMQDDVVLPGPQKDEIEKLRQKKIKATFTGINEGHKLTSKYLKEADKWLLSLGYTKIAT